MDLLRYPYASRRAPVMAVNGVVATSQPLAAQAGLEILWRGGNAADAAIAAAAALTVVEPTSNGLGGDAFAIVWDGERLHGLNGSGRWPAGMDPESLRVAGHARVPELGWASVTVPGTPATWHDLHQRFGRLDLPELLAPAIRYAEEGFAVSPVISCLWEQAAPDLLGADDPAMAGWQQVFTRDGRLPSAGERWTSPGHAACLKALAERGVRDFYEGEVAARLCDFAARTGGALRAEDLAHHCSEWVQPISIRYRDHEVWELPPNAQGIAALQALGILDGAGAGELTHGSAELWHLQIEAMKLAFADAYRYVADPAHAAVPATGMLAPDYLQSRRRLIGEQACDPGPGEPPTGGTVYLCTADRNGMMVSFIQSNYTGFGSGVVMPELGVAFQSRAACFRLEPGHPNSAAPGKRPRHTIIPAFLTRNGEPVGPFGVMGAEMQPQGHVQVVCGMVDHDLNPQAALDAPRWQVTAGGVRVEPATPVDVETALTRRGHRVTRARDTMDFGRGQIIIRTPDGVYIAGSEPRADGAAVGY
jgi:gamma-glutamyltranspeptidase/glutathione hydrolase